jgi:sugar lactone lactonase YvrE
MKMVKILRSNAIIFIFLFYSRVTAQMIVTVAGNGTQGFNNDGIAATAAQLNNPYNVAVDNPGNIYIADYDNNRIRKVSIASGLISTIAGTGVAGYSGDQGPAISAMIKQPRGIVVDGTGNVYFSDQGNFRIRKIDASGTITTVAGTGQQGYSGNGGLATLAQIKSSHSLAIDPNGDLVIADTWNHCIRKVIMSTGNIITIAGTGSAGFSGDNGLATLATLKYPTGIAIDGSGNIYITDQENNRIRKVSATDSLIYTIGGTGIAGYSGDNGPAIAAELNSPVGLAVDAPGNIYISDSQNNRIRKIDTFGNITSLSGDGTAAYNGDSISCYQAQLNGPTDMTLDQSGNLYFCDAHNYRIRKIYKSLVNVDEMLNDKILHLYPIPASDKISVRLDGKEMERIEILNMIGETVCEMQASGSAWTIDVTNLTQTIYIVKIFAEGHVYHAEFAKK